MTGSVCFHLFSIIRVILYSTNKVILSNTTKVILFGQICKGTVVSPGFLVFPMLLPQPLRYLPNPLEFDGFKIVSLKNSISSNLSLSGYFLIGMWELVYWNYFWDDTIFCSSSDAIFVVFLYSGLLYWYYFPPKGCSPAVLFWGFGKLVLENSALFS